MFAVSLIKVRKQMNTKRLSSLFFAATLPAVASAQMFHATVLPPLPGLDCAASGMNASGDVVGTCQSRAVVWHNGVPRAIDPLPGGTWTSGIGINALGVVTGMSNSASSGAQPQTFVTTPGGLLNVDPMNGANVDSLGITDSGAVFANINKSGGGRATDWYVAMLAPDPKSPGRYRETALPKSNATTKFPWTFGVAINNLGQVIGLIQALNTPQTGGLWNNDAAHTLTLLPDFMGGTQTDPRGLNDIGQITGAAAVDYLVSHAAIFSADASHTPTDLGTLPGDLVSEGVAINNAGQVIGTSGTGATPRVFFYANGVIQDLSTLINPADGVFTLTNPVAINNAGQIVVNGTTGSAPYALLLTPAQ